MNLLRNIRNVYTGLRISQKYRRELKLHSWVLNLGRKILSDKRNYWDEQDNFTKILTLFSARNFHRMISMKILCKKGLAKDAILILRAMFEDWVHLKYMSQNETLATQFWEYDCYNKIKLAEYLLSSKSQKIDRERLRKRLNELREEWKLVKYKFEFTNRKGKVEIYKNWCNKDLRALCLELGDDVQETYDLVYRYLSSFVHPTSLNANKFVLGTTKDGRNVTIHLSGNDDFVKEILDTSMVIFGDTLSISNKKFKLGYDSKLKRLQNVL